MATNKNNTRQATPAGEQDQEETLELSELVERFAGHACTFQTFKMLQGMFNDYVGAGLMEAMDKEYLQDFMTHFILISEIIFELESLAAQKVIDKAKAKAFIGARLDRLAG